MNLGILTAETYCLILAVTFMASFIHGSVGLGFPMIATPLLAFLVDMHTAILVTLIPTLLINMLSIRDISLLKSNLKIYWPLGVYAFLGSLLGAIWLLETKSDFFEVILAFSMLIYLLTVYFNVKKLACIKERKNTSMMIFGLLGGVLGGSANVMAPIMIIFSIEMSLSVITSIQVFNYCFLMGKMAQIIVFSSYGSLNSANVVEILPVLVIVICGFFVGFKARRYLSPALYMRILHMMLLIMSMALIVGYYVN